MKSKSKKAVKKRKLLRDQIFNSAHASFNMEGIPISKLEAEQTLKKVEISLGK